MSESRRADAPATNLVKAVDPAALELATRAAEAAGETFGNAFAPGLPLTPFDGVSGLPRAWDFPTGYNLKGRADRDGRLSFTLLKSLIDSYDVASMCINHRIDDIRSLAWNVRAADWVEQDIPQEIARARAALKKPDGVNTFRSWLSMFLQDVLRYDAGTLHRRRNMGGQVIGLEVVSGVTIAPVLDYYGRRPAAPAPAYVQYVAGTPWKWLTTADLIYSPFRPQSDSPYGIAPMEQVLLSANTDMRFQNHWMNWFTEGNVPEGFATAPEDLRTPEQLEKWEAYWDAMNTDVRTKHKLKMMPHGTELTFPRDKKFDDAFPMFLMRKVCAAFHVTPNDLGFTEDVNRATGDTQVDVQFRIGTLPLVRHVEDILNDYLQDDLGLPVVFEFDTGQEKEDRENAAKADEIDIRNGVISPDEAREKRHGLATDASRPTPRFVMTTSGPVLLASLTASSAPIDPQTAAPESTPTAPAPEAPAAPVAKAALVPATEVAGMALLAADTGRVLMIQRAVVEGDPAAGRWEFPGGHLEAGEEPAAASVREWSEETGLRWPDTARLTDTWDKGKYRLHVAVIDAESMLPINPSEGRVTNPDDPGGDAIEACAWWEVADLPGMPALREEARATPWELLTMVTGGTGSLDDIRKELQRWKANTLTRLKRGQRPRLFVSDVIPAATIRKVWTALNAVTDTGAVDGAFALAEDDAGPKAGTPSWRDDPPVRTPQHDVDLALTDHWAPRMRAALRAVWTRTELLDAITAAQYNRPPIRKDQSPPPPPDGVAALMAGADTDGVSDALKALQIDAYEIGIKAAQAQLGLTAPDWDAWRPGIPAERVTGGAGWLAVTAEADVTVRDITETTAARLAAAIEAGVADGDSVDGIARALNRILDDPSRAELIAHTESARMLTAAAMDTYVEMGVQEWDLLTSSGACPTCLEVADSNPHPIDGDVKQPPIHPRCRCAASPRVPKAK